MITTCYCQWCTTAIAKTSKLAGQGKWDIFSRSLRPVGASIDSSKDYVTTIDRIADRDPMRIIPKSDRINKYTGSDIFIL
jgi:hypothetical protein